MSPDRRQAAWLGLVATLVTLPVALPGAEAYMDNAAHLVMLRAMATEILPIDHWYAGWTELAEAGFAAGQVNAPLAWLPVAALAALGLPLVPLYLLGVPASNVVFTLGAWRLGRRLFADPRAAAWGAALAAISLPEVYGIAGAAGGMWPFRLATGVFFLGLGARWGIAGRAAWIAGLLLLHTYAGVAGLAHAALAAAWSAGRRDLRDTFDWLVAITLGLGLSAVYWYPLLDPALREVLADTDRAPLDLALLLTLPVDARRVVSLGRPLTLLAGPWGLPAAGLVLVGVALAIRRRQLVDRALAAQIGVAMALLAVSIAVVLPATGWGFLGPNPWRYYVFLRVPLILLAGLGLAGRRWVLPLLVAATAATIGGGVTVLPLRLHAEAEWRDLEATWSEVAASAPQGRVYVEDTVTKGDEHEPFWNSHVGALFALRTGIPVLGTWYGLTPIRSHPWTTSEGPYVLGQRPEKGQFTPEYFSKSFRLYQVDRVITASPTLDALLATDAGYERFGGHGRYAAYRLVPPLLPALGIAPESGALTDIEAQRGHLAATLRLTAPEALVRTRQTWHPWWRATVDGQEMPVLLDSGSGMAVVSVSRPGHLEITWADRDRAGKGISVVSLLCLLVLGVRRTA